MKIQAHNIRFAATDLSNHLACPHLTALDLQVARGERSVPDWRAPDLRTIQELGLRHENAYLAYLRELRLRVVVVNEVDEQRAIAKTLGCMQDGVEVIAQGALADGNWFGRPDILRRGTGQSVFGNWSYEVYDCKLAAETKATALLQLALYSDLLAVKQGCEPEFMHVVPAGKAFCAEPYRISEYAAYYRYIKERIESRCQSGGATYPEPCAQCDVCVWFKECATQRRSDDHLSLVAGISQQQKDQLGLWNIGSMSGLATLPIPVVEKPKHGSRGGYERVREQARVQVESRETGKLIRERLPLAEGSGFFKLPEPNSNDMFVDLEGDPFARSLEPDRGLQYLFGFVAGRQGEELKYQKKWALSLAEEKLAFEWLIDEVMRRWEESGAMHVYHFGSYEPSAFKRLMGRHTTREDEVDRMLRAHLFVDLHRVFKQSTRASVEEYSLKKLEEFYKFARNTPLEVSREAMRYVEHGLELGWDGEVPESFRTALEGYNSEDCLSTAAMRGWLEEEQQAVVERGNEIARPALENGDAAEELSEQQARVAELVNALIRGIPVDDRDRSEEQRAQWMMAQLIDWHRREDKASWWEGSRLAELDEEELKDERAGLAGLRFLSRLSVEQKIPVDRYEFDKQDTEVRKNKDLYEGGIRVGNVVEIDIVKRTIDIKKTKKTADDHPKNIYWWDRPFRTAAQTDSLFRLGQWILENGIDAAGEERAARDLLLKRAPRLTGGEVLEKLPGEPVCERACRIVGSLDHSVLAIQGPPGAGKTYTAARMICDLVRRGKKVGVTALSHKVIRNLLENIVAASSEPGSTEIRCMQVGGDDELISEIARAKSNGDALTALSSGSTKVVGGTSWLWSAREAHLAVDVLFIDEAGQMALADVVALAQAGQNLVLVGDPQQLERPLKGSHPDGAEKSALQHLIGGRKTIATDMGLLLPETWRMHSKVCSFTSELFYDGRLRSRAMTDNRYLTGHAQLDGAGLWFRAVSHAGNRNFCAEEVAAIAEIVETLVEGGVEWYRSKGNRRPLTLEDILIVAPYNAQVADISSRLPKARVGTVDKFQGQEAPVVIYSLTTSSPQDAPRGMEFLYSLNRLNVATSRALSNVIVVGSPKLFEPDCRNPHQMRLANALCRYLEMATVIEEPAMIAV